MSASAPHTVWLNVEDTREVHEANVASGQTVEPGMLLEWSSGDLQGRAGAAESAQKMVALEKEVPDDETVDTLEDDWTAGQLMRFIYAQPGDLLYMILADGENVTAGAVLGSHADAGHVGALTVDATALAGSIVGYAQESVNATAAATRIKVRIA